jgi:hypothetical protein
VLSYACSLPGEWPPLWITEYNRENFRIA